MSMQSRLLMAAACAAGSLVMADGALAQLYVMFAPGTDETYREQVVQQIEARNARLGLDRFTAGNRWPGALGTPALVTWSIVPDGTGPIQPAPGTLQTPGIADMVFRLDASFGSRALWLSLIQNSFQADPTNVSNIQTNGTQHDWGNISGLSFTQVVAPPDLSDPENPIYFDTDSGAIWDETGSANGPLSPGGGLPADPDVGDIRIAGKKIDGFGGVVAYAYGPGDPDYPGEIVIDTQEEWARPDFQFRFFRNAMSRMIGFAIGLEPVCPQSKTRIMEPFDNFGFTGPQDDDIRGVQSLYGDYYEEDDDPTTATLIDFDQTNLGGQNFAHDFRSLDQLSDLDYYVIHIDDLSGENSPIDVDLDVRVAPIGTSYQDGPTINGGCGGAPTSEITAEALRDIRIALLDSNFDTVTVYDQDDRNRTQPLPRDAFGWLDRSQIGNPESFYTKITQPGDYYVIIGGTGNTPNPTQPQLYSSEISAGNKIFNNGISFATLVLAPAPNGLGAGPIVDIPAGTTPEGQTVYRGTHARVGLTEDHWPSLGHAATEYLSGPPPLPSQDFPPQRIAWPGNPTSPGALGGVSSHATAAIACAVGNFRGITGDAFVGAAPDAPWLAASIGIRNVGISFTVSRDALLYGLFGLADPDTALSLGLPTTATVLTNSWGGSGDLRGDSFISQAFDAVVFMTETPAVVSAGNEGAVDNTAQCGGLGGNAPGSAFRGSRTAAAPSVSFNTISVGMAGKKFDLEAGIPPLPEFLSPATTPYELVEDHSSKGPVDSFNFETGATTFNARPGIDLVSIGTGYLIEDTNPLLANPPGEPCSYIGHQSVIGLSLPSVNPFEPDPDHPASETYSSTFGTSFSGPAVAGAIALLQDYALSQTPPIKLHPAVIRAILLTAARPFEGWSNNGAPAIPQDNRDGRDPFTNDDVVNRQTTQGLDFAQGAGFLDVNRAMEILKGMYSNPVFSGMVVGAPSTDSPLTDPTKPTIVTPPNEVVLIRPIPASAISAAEPQYESVDDLPRSPIEIADMLARSREGLPDNPIFRPQADFGDPDIGRVGGSKSAAGVTFDDRVPSKLPPSPNRPGIAPTVPPVELPGRIVVNPIGWDHGNLGERVLRLPSRGNFQGGAVPAGYIDYFIAFAFDGSGDYLSATLTWLREVEMDFPDFSNIDNPRVGEIERLELENLDLELIQCDALGQILDDHVFLGVIGQDDGGQIWTFSRSTLNTVEHLFTKTFGLADADDDEIIPAGFYTLRVRWVNGNGFTGQEYDLFNNSAAAVTQYGLAWRVEPSGGSDPTTSSALSAKAPSTSLSLNSQRMRVFQMFVNAFGKTSADSDFNPAFDVNHDGAVDVGDFVPLYQFWWGRG